MTLVRQAPAAFSFALLGAHYLRSGKPTVVAICLVLAGVALVRRRWAAWIARLGLVAAAGVWTGTLVAIASQRQAAGEPWGRMAVILGAVAATTLLSAVALPGFGGSGAAGRESADHRPGS